MSQEIINSNLLALERKLTLLISEYKSIKEDLIQLKDENENLKGIIEASKNQIKNFQNKINISKIVDNVAVEDKNTAELKKTIDNYIREIDKCIAYLSR